MDDRSRVLTATCVGAAIGALWGWLYLTGNGGRVRARIGPTIEKAKMAVDEGRRLVTGIMALPESA
jgi:hypothetical protein